MYIITYPTLNSILDFDKIPDELDVITNSVQNLVSRIHYKDFFASKDSLGTSFYSLSILLNDSLGFRVPGTEITIKLNPDPNLKS